MKAWYILLLLVGITGAGIAQKALPPQNFRLQADGSEVFLHNGEFPEAVARVLQESVGTLVFSEPLLFTEQGTSYRAVKASDAFVVGDHMIMANRHGFETTVFEAGPEGKALVGVDKPDFARYKLWFLFKGDYYEATVLPSSLMNDIDLVLIVVHDLPHKKFSAPPVTFASDELPEGLGKFYTLGVYQGCPKIEGQDKNAKPENIPHMICLTTGAVSFRLFKGYRQEKNFKNELLGSFLGLTTYGFSAAPYLNERGECVGPGKGIDFNALRTYFIPAPLAVMVLQHQALIAARTSTQASALKK